MNIQIVDRLDEGAWRSFVENHPSGNIFHTPEMHHVFARTRGCSPRMLAAVADGGRVLSLFTPVLVSLRGGPARRLMTRAIAYGGLLCEESPEGAEALRLLLQASDRQTKNDALFTELRHLSDAAPFQPVLEACGYQYEAYLDYLIDTSGTADDVMQNIGARTRKNIRHALRKGNVIIEEVGSGALGSGALGSGSLHSGAQMQAWYSLVQKTYLNARVPLADISMFQAAQEILGPKGMAKFYLARIGSQYVAATVELPYKDVVYGWYSGVDRAFGSEYPGELLMWEILRWSAENGYKIYDFGGAGKPEEQSGVRDFKAKFGGRLVCYGRNTKVHSPRLLRWSKWGYEKYRELLRLLQRRAAVDQTS